MIQDVQTQIDRRGSVQVDEQRGTQLKKKNDCIHILWHLHKIMMQLSAVACPHYRWSVYLQTVALTEYVDLFLWTLDAGRSIYQRQNTMVR